MVWQRIKTNAYWWYLFVGLLFCALLVRAVVINEVGYIVVDVVVIGLSVVQFMSARNIAKRKHDKY